MLDLEIPHAIILVVVGLLIFMWGLKAFKFKRLIENTPTSKIRSLAMGLVEIYGEAIPVDKPLKSPMCKQDCVYYATRVEQQKGSGDNKRWVIVFSKCSQERFYIKDETGKVLIDPASAQLSLRTDRIATSGFGKDPSKDIIQFLNENNIRYEGLFGMNKTMRYTETYIAAKDKLYVLGTASINADSKATSKGHENVIIKKESKKDVLFISDSDEKKILQGYGWLMNISVYGGAILIIAGIGIAIYVLT